jgi:uncharacterized protein YchJ
MVPFLEILPSRWDLSVIHDGRRYWVVDLWCLMPDCPCTDVALDFVAAHDETAEHVVVDLETGEPDDEEASEAGLGLWKALVEDPDALDELRARRETVKRVAAELSELLAPPATVVSGQKTGRNEVCPCGSGKKFKRCCGGVKDPQGT